ncbi:MAG: fibronectin type III-like domain-contianing protein [Clostridiales bacterium]|nr:fibronectin type III-like domain-contianing protein [Clostridiales bacterium]
MQLYIRDVVASVTRPKKELKRYKKVLIPAGEMQTVEIELDTNTLGFHNRSLEYVVEKGDFRIMAGTNSEDYIETKITLR